MSLPKVQDQILADNLKFAFRLERLKAGLSAASSARLDKLPLLVLDDVRRSGVFNSGRFMEAVDRLKDFQGLSQVTVVDVYSKVWNHLRVSLASLAEKQSQAVLDSINNSAGFELVAGHLAAAQFKEIVTVALVFGAPIREWLERQAGQVHQRIFDAVRDSSLSGEDFSKVAAKLTATAANTPGAVGEGFIKPTQAALESLIRTSVAAVSNDAKLATFEENAEVVRGIQWVSVLDNSTTGDCAGLNGKCWDLDEKPIGHTTEFPGDPPMHWGCRSTVIPLLKPWSDL